MGSSNSADRTSGALPKAGAPEAARFASQILLPVLAGGVIVRRPRGMALVERTQWDRRGIELVRALRRRHGPGPLRITAKGRSLALVMEPEDVNRILAATPEPFSPATREKVASLAQFQPHGVLISDGEKRDVRRSFHEQVLQTQEPMHQLAGKLTHIVTEEAGLLLRDSADTGELGWSAFHDTWWRIVRRIVLGDAARDDRVLTAQLDRLRSAGNWSMLSPRRSRLRDAFHQRVESYVHSREPDNLAALVADTHAAPGTDPAGQIPHWLFAYDAAGLATLRTLALLATHPAQAAPARAEAASYALDKPQELPFLRACALESLRLFPTTPLLLRESTQETAWDGGTLPAGTGFILYSPYLQRAEPAAPNGDSFVPRIWAEGEAQNNRALVPFSSGPAGCPGRKLVLLTVSTLLAALLQQHTYTLTSHPSLRPADPVPATLDHFALHFRAHPG